MSLRQDLEESMGKHGHRQGPERRKRIAKADIRRKGRFHSTVEYCVAVKKEKNLNRGSCL
jgi:hypothetical protein